MAKQARDPVARLIPLKPNLYLILLVLSTADCHAYAVRKEVERRTDGKVRLGSGTLYRSIERLREEALVEESEERPAPHLDDERRRYYRITDLGRRVLKAESERLAALVRAAADAGAV